MQSMLLSKAYPWLQTHITFPPPSTAQLDLAVLPLSQEALCAASHVVLAVKIRYIFIVYPWLQTCETFSSPSTAQINLAGFTPSHEAIYAASHMVLAVTK